MISDPSDSPGSALPGSDPSAWFKVQVMPLEPRLRSWLRGRFPHARDHDDLIQEAYIKLLRAHRRRPIERPGPLLFLIARNLAYDRIRRDIRSPFEDISRDRACLVPCPRPATPETTSRRQELRLLADAISALPPRGRTALELFHFHGLSAAETGRRMGISEHTVNAHVASSIRHCSAYFWSKGALDRAPKHLLPAGAKRSRRHQSWDAYFPPTPRA